MDQDNSELFPTTDEGSDEDARRLELLRRFAELPPEKARGQIALLPYYHQLENEITKPNQGIFVTRYFQTRWRPSLGPEGSSIVLAMRLLADKADGTTVARQETIAQVSGVSLRSLKRWLSENEDAVASMSEAWRAQWRLLHAYFLKTKTARYLIRREGNLSRAKRTTSLYKVAMDDPVHPDDEGKLFVKAAERIIQDEAEKAGKPLENQGSSYKGQVGPHRQKQIIREDSDDPSYKGQVGPHQARPEWPSLSLSDRINVVNVKGTTTAGRLTPNVFRQDPRVQNLGIEERGHREALAAEIGSWLLRKSGKSDMEPHKSAGLHRRIAYFMPEHLIRQAMRDLDDRLTDAREGKKTPVRNLSGLFYGFIRRLADQQGVDLYPRAKDTVEAK